MIILIGGLEVNILFCVCAQHLRDSIQSPNANAILNNELHLESPFEETVELSGIENLTYEVKHSGPSKKYVMEPACPGLFSVY